MGMTSHIAVLITPTTISKIGIFSNTLYLFLRPIKTSINSTEINGKTSNTTMHLKIRLERPV